MTKYKTNDQDIIDILKYGNLGYLDLIEYVEETYNLHGLFLDCDFGYRSSDCMNFDGIINVFPFYNYKFQFTLQEQDNKHTRVIFGRYTSTFKTLHYFCPNSISHKTITTIKSREQFVSRLCAWHKFIDKSKILLLDNTKKYMDQLDNNTINDINSFLLSNRFNYTVSLESMKESYETFTNSLDDNIDMIKQFVNPCKQYEIE